MKSNRVISILTAVIVVFLAASAFVLSYEALRDLALNNGIRPGLAFLWPLGIDSFMLAASLAVLRANLNKERSLYPWGLVGVFTMVSVGFNVVHANGNLLAQAIAAISPLVVFLSFELLMAMVKSETARANVLKSLTDLAADAEARRQELNAELSAIRQELNTEVNTLESQVNTLSAKKERLERQVGELETVKEHRQHDELAGFNANREDEKQAAIAALLAFYTANPGASKTAAGQEIGRSRQTVSNYLTELAQAGRVHINGKGIEVLTPNANT